MTNNPIAKFVSDLECFCEEATQDIEMYQEFADEREGEIRDEAARTVQKIFKSCDIDISFQAAMKLLITAGAFHFLCECFESPIWKMLAKAKQQELISIRDDYEGRVGSEHEV